MNRLSSILAVVIYTAMLAFLWALAVRYRVPPTPPTSGYLITLANGNKEHVPEATHYLHNQWGELEFYQDERLVVVYDRRQVRSFGEVRK